MTVVSITANGKTMTSTATYSDDGNRLVSTTDALGKVTKYGYNEITNVLDWVQYPEDTDGTEGTADTRTKYTYDSMYRMATAACTTDTGKNLSAAYTYTDDYLTSVQTPSTTYSFTYGDFGLRTGVSIGERTLATYNYTDDRNNYLESLDYGNDDSVEYTYDKKGRVTSETYEDGDTVTYAYDNDGALAKVTDSATGRTTTYYYDFTDRLMKQVESGTGYSHAVGYQYDTINNLTQMVETINGVDHTTSYTYDDDNRIESVTTDGVTVEYTYDSFGRVSQQVTKNGDTTVLTESFTYTEPAANTTSSQIATYTTAAPNGYSVTYTYTYDNNGNILTIDDGTDTIRYTYDSANQLIRESIGSGSSISEWAYDSSGNVTILDWYTELGFGVSLEFEYEDSTWGDLLTSNGSAITYDGVGNMLSDGTWTYTWEHGRQLATATKSGTTWSYTYNTDGLRTGKTNGTDTYSYVYNGSQLTGMTKGTDTLHFTYDASGVPVAVIYNGTVYYYATNIQGDIVAILDSTGTAVVTYSYDIWGSANTPAGTMASTLGTLNPLRYRGYVYDHETGLYYLQSRYYNPGLCRFINADAFISTGQGILGNNMFAYCNNSPVCLFDPSGTYAVSLPILSKGLNLPAGKGTPIMINGETYYYYSVVQRGGYRYEYWYDANGDLIHIRHNTDHKQPWDHDDPHDHKGGKDKDGYNTIIKKPLKKDDSFKPPEEFAALPTFDNIIPEGVAIGVAATYTVYQIIKWSAATFLAPSTGGFSYAAAGLCP